MPVDNKVKKMVEELRAALVEAIRSSEEVGEAVRKIRSEGFSLQLMLSCEQREGAGGDPQAGGREASDPSCAEKVGLDPGNLAVSAPETRKGGPEPGANPAFLLNSQDVAFLQTMGIDPTRPGRARKRRRSS